MKKILGIIVLGMLLSGCGSSNYAEFEKGWSEQGSKSAKACSLSKIENVKKGSCYWAAKDTQREANNIALRNCKKDYPECFVVMENKTTVYTYDDHKQKDMAKIINDSKKTCNSLGFKEGSEKFTDCTLRLYTQEVDNKIALSVSKQQSSSSGTMTISDPVRDRQNQIDRGMKMLSGGCTLGIDC